ncbi:winged helix-turn-helix transcriptional regulator [Candidatus Woesebacteria bacterium]|nr:winged helix-turn-helix transcriptional regulator [Candidatus Woesebacteria bacterium]
MLTQEEIHSHKTNISANELVSQRSLLAKCLADPTCFKILYVLSESKYACPSDLSEILNLSLPSISHQLAKLRQMGLVSTIRHGQVICYSLQNSSDTKLIQVLISLMLRKDH